MVYQKFKPADALQPFVAFYYIWEHNEPLAKPLEVHSPPKGLGGLVINYGDPCQTANEKGEWSNLPASFVVGQCTKNYSLRLKAKPAMLGIAFLPAGISHLLGVPMISFTDHRIDLGLVLGAEANHLQDQILECKTNDQRIATVDQFLLDKLHKAACKFDLIDYAVMAIQEHKGILSISQLSDALCISPRQFRRRFTEKVGVSPKLLSRIKRFNYVANLLTTSPDRYMDLVQEGGYYDQAHFIHDFCDFSGKNPSEFISYHKALAMLVGA